MPAKEYANTYCVPESIMCALLWSEKMGDKTQIEITRMNDDDSENHAQAMAFHNGEWVYLTTDWHPKEGLICRPNPRHFPDKPIKRQLPVRQFIIEQSEVLKALKPAWDESNKFIDDLNKTLKDGIEVK